MRSRGLREAEHDYPDPGSGFLLAFFLSSIAACVVMSCPLKRKTAPARQAGEPPLIVYLPGATYPPFRAGLVLGLVCFANTLA